LLVGAGGEPIAIAFCMDVQRVGTAAEVEPTPAPRRRTTSARPWCRRAVRERERLVAGADPAV
jgi:hypothetical protein